jgi:hypothetical protein
VIQIPATAPVVVMHEPISFRNGIDGTASIARVVLKHDPMDGAMFVFCNKCRHSLRILYYDGLGFWLCTRRLSKGRYPWWPKGPGDAVSSKLLTRELQVLIWAGDPSQCAFPEIWRRVS